MGQCREFPFIIVKGATLNELAFKVHKDLEVYFNTFPKRAKEILEKHGDLIRPDSQIILKERQEGWQHHEELMTIPIEHKK